MKQSSFIRVLHLGSSAKFAVDTTFIQHEEEILLFDASGLKGSKKTDNEHKLNTACLATQIAAKKIMLFLIDCCRKHTVSTSYSETFFVISDHWIKEFTFTSKKRLPNSEEASGAEIDAIVEEFVENTLSLIESSILSNDTHFEGNFVSLKVKNDEQKNTCPIPNSLVEHVLRAREKQKEAKKAAESKLKATMNEKGVPTDIQEAILAYADKNSISITQIVGIGGINSGSSCEEKESTTKNQRDDETEEKNDG